MRARRTLGATLVLGLVLAGCGSSSLSAVALRTRAGRICAAAQQLAARIAVPTRPSQEPKYLRAGIAAFTPRLTALHALDPPPDLARQYRMALAADGAGVRALRAALKGLEAGNDPVVAIKTLQQELQPLESRADSAWESVGIPVCDTR